MMTTQTYARIDSGVVVELLTTSQDITTLFNPALIWVPVVVSGAQVGWTYAAGVFSPPAPTLAQAQAAQIVAMYAAYQSAIAQDVSFTTSANVTKTFQADPASIANAQAMIAAYTPFGVPAGFYWVAGDNTQVPFTLADLQGLAKAMGDQGWAAFRRLQDRKASIRAASTSAEVQAVSW